MKTFRLFTILFAAVFTFLASSCAEKVEVVDNTRDYALPKTMFSGEWFARSMITDVNYISSYAAPGYIGTPSPTERIRWQITKNELIGYRVDEVVPGSNDHPLGRTLDEHKVVSYSISHFDLRNSFNPQTGQENNVISESTTGKRWYERTHININPSSVKFYDMNMSGNTIRKGSTADKDFYQLDFGKDHINIVNKVEMPIAISGPYGGSELVSTPVTMVTSMIRIPDEQKLRENGAGYIPWAYPAQTPKRDENGNLVRTPSGERYYIDLFDRFGFFQTVRQTYDRFDSKVWDNKNYYIQRFNMWQKVYDVTDNGDGTKSYSIKPMKDRVVDPIIYFMAEDFPEDMKPAALRVGTLWNQAFRKALTDIGYELDKYCPADSPNCEVVFAVCENPVYESSPYYCKNKGGTGVKLFGDLRYNFLKLGRPSGNGGLLGYGPSSNNDRTGETINGWSVTYYSAINRYAKSALDEVKMYLGHFDVNSAAWLDGDYYDGRMFDEKDPRETLSFDYGNNNDHADHEDHHDHAEEGHDHSKEHSFEGSLSRNLKKLAVSTAAMSQGWSDFYSDRQAKEQMEQTLKNLQQEMMSQGLYSNRYTQFLKKMRVPAQKEMYGFHESHFRIGDEREKYLAKLYKAKDYKAILEFNMARENYFASRNMITDELADPTAISMSKRYAKIYDAALKGLTKGTPEYDQKMLETDKIVLSEIRDACYIGTTLHEIGHNLGLRHNFAASVDVLNYIQPGETVPVRNIARDSEGNPTESWLSRSEREEPNKGYWSIVTDENLGAGAERDANEIDAGRLEYQYSSIMDYGGNFAADAHGLGPYDIAAIKFGYLEHIEVYADANGNPTEHPLASRRAIFDSNDLGLIRQLNNQRISVPFNPNAMERSNGFERITVPGRGQYTIVDYEFCTDDYADGFNLSCSRWDLGRYPGEIARVYEKKAESDYFFLNYRRGSTAFTSGLNFGIVNSALQRQYFYGYRSGFIYSFYKELIFGGNSNYDNINTYSQYRTNPQFRSQLTQDQILEYADLFGVTAATMLNTIVNTIMTPGATYTDRFGIQAETYGWDKKSNPFDTAENIDVLAVDKGSIAIDNELARPTFSEYIKTKANYIQPGRYGYFNNKIGAMYAMLIGIPFNLEQFGFGDANTSVKTLGLGAAFPEVTAELLVTLFFGEANRMSAIPLTKDGASYKLAGPNASVDKVIHGDTVLRDIQTIYRDPDFFNLTDVGSINYQKFPRVKNLVSSYEFEQGFLLAYQFLVGQNEDRTWKRYLTLIQQGDNFDVTTAGKVPVVYTDDTTGIVWKAYRYDSVKNLTNQLVSVSIAADILDKLNAMKAELNDVNTSQARKAEITKMIEQSRYRLDYLYSLQVLL